MIIAIIGHIIHNSAIGSPLKYNLLNTNGNEINIGDSVKIYVKREIKKLQNNNSMINIDDKAYKYCGKITDYKLIEERGNYLFFNETSDNFLEEIDNITLFEGVLDFDSTGENKSSKNWKLKGIAIWILTILFCFLVPFFIFFIII